MEGAPNGDTFQIVQDYYGKVLQNSGNLKTSACTAASRPPLRIRNILARIPAEVLEKFLWLWCSFTGR